jgi:ribosomal-protein-alanine N-acetyltransferase
MPKTHVRPALVSDFPTLLDIDQASFPPGIAYDSSELSYFMQRQGAETLVAEIDNQIVGFILVEMRQRKKTATMITLDVRAEYRRQGCARELLAASEEVLRERSIQRYELQVDVGNSAAIAFYQKHGFTTICTLKSYYSNGNDAYLMVKRLS